MSFLFGSAVFLSAFLLFVIQPLLAKQLLPRFGSAAFVWTSSLLFFQGGLLLGYAYAFLLAKYCSFRTQHLTHFLLLFAALFFLPLHIPETPSLSSWPPPGQVIVLLTLTIALPYWILTASSPLLQQWYCGIRHTPFPYHYYAISNAGALLGLLGYPFLIEPWIGLRQQAKIWAMGYGIYTLLCVFCLWATRKAKPFSPKIGETPPLFQMACWIGLPFLTSSLLIEETQFLTQNVINLPFTWILPLSAYFISFIVTFSKPEEGDKRFWAISFFIWLGAVSWIMHHHLLSGISTILSFLTLFYVACVLCHGALIQMRPLQNHLTTFYLLIALGSVLGSLCNYFVIPSLLGAWSGLYLPLSLISFLALFWVLKTSPKPRSLSKQGVVVASGACLLIFLSVCLQTLFFPEAHVVAEQHTFYGRLRANETAALRTLHNGTILHGLQFLSKDKQHLPTAYYGEDSGIGLAIGFLRQTAHHPLTIGIIGLGTGTLAVLATAGDQIDFYEIDPNVQAFATHYFSFLSQSQATVHVILGDGRQELQKLLERPRHKKYDLLVLDAFSGDAIPVHLLTKEAVMLYHALLTPDGILAVNTTNTYLNLRPLTRGLAQSTGYQHYWLKSGSNEEKALFATTWALLSQNKALEKWLITESPSLSDKKTAILWTDDFNSLLPLLKPLSKD